MRQNDIRKIKELINDQLKVNNSISSNQASVTNGSNSNSNNNNNSNSNQLKASPNELQPPSPASSVGSAGSGSNIGNTTTNQTNQITNMQKLISLYERYYKYNEYNLRSQAFWDSNKHQIEENKFLTGKFSFAICIFLFIFFVCQKSY
jgi:hypothetical protein